MKRLRIVGATVTAILGIVGCSPKRAGVPPVPDKLTIAAALAEMGYVGTPIRREGSYSFTQAAIATTPIALLLDSGSPFDLLLDPSLELGTPSGIHNTDVLSAYWTSTTSKGRWAFVDRLAVGASTLDRLEAKMEPSPLPVTRALLGATALISQGAIIDYATDTLYLLSSRAPLASAPPTVDKEPSLRVALERAGQYQTFLALMQQAGLMPLLERTPRRDAASDSIAWLGLRIPAPLLSGVGAMPPNDVHLQLTREALDRRLRRPGRHTAFVPTDAAFARLPAETLRAWRADTTRLALLLGTHLFPGVAIDTSDIRTFIRGAAVPSRAAFGFHVLGSRIDVDRLTSWEEGRVVARATVVQPNLRAANGIAHGIDRVLSPFPEFQPLMDALSRLGYVGIPLHRREDGNGYVVHATVNDVPVPLALDTGSPLELALDQQWVERLQRSRGRDYVVAFDSVRLGSVDIQRADFGDRMRWDQSQGYRTSAGAVGSLFLAKYRAFIDYGAGVLYLRMPGTSIPAKSTP